MSRPSQEVLALAGLIVAKLAILPPQPPQLLALNARHTALATTFIATGLTHPVADRLR